MPDKYPSPIESKHWDALGELAQSQTKKNMTDLFDEDPSRFETHHIQHNGLCLDYSRSLTSQNIWSHLIGLARDQDIEGWRDKMFSGKKINIFENRAVLHTALRAPENSEINVDGHNVIPEIHAVLARMREFCEGVHNGSVTGHTGQRFKDIVSIGIGGSYLGPEMAYRALSYHHIPEMNVHFIANVDGHDIDQTLRNLDPETTLFLIASKTFTTQETMANAVTARKWLVSALGQDSVEDHFVALSTNVEKASEFGISEENVFPFWDWVGGRFSLWSSIGLPLALGIGFEKFRELLDGAYDMDQHFKNAPIDKNMPVILALTGLWHRNFHGASSLAVLPYDQRLKFFPAYLQQLDMESNGKSVDRNNQPVSYGTGPILFGEPGTNGQHAFYQLIHQGTELIPCEFIGVKTPDHAHNTHHDILLSHMLAQATALMTGRSLEDSGNNPQKQFKGNKPSTILLMDALTPFSLGQLIALYEHKIFCQGILWNINSFDQWGVELGKEIASDILPLIENVKQFDIPAHLGLLGLLKGD